MSSATSSVLRNGTVVADEEDDALESAHFRRRSMNGESLKNLLSDTIGTSVDPDVYNKVLLPSSPLIYRIVCLLVEENAF